MSQIACSLYPTATNKNLGGDTVGIDTSSTFKSTSVDFEFGVPFPETTGDGTKVETTATLSGNTLTKDQVVSELYLILEPPNAMMDPQRAVTSSGVSRIEKRIFSEDGEIMDLIHTIPGKPEIKSVRVYKKISS